MSKRKGRNREFSKSYQLKSEVCYSVNKIGGAQHKISCYQVCQGATFGGNACGN